MSPAKILDIAATALRHAGVSVGNQRTRINHHDVQLWISDGQAMLSIPWRRVFVTRRRIVSIAEQALGAYGLRIDGDAVNATATLVPFSPVSQRRWGA